MFVVAVQFFFHGYTLELVGNRNLDVDIGIHESYVNNDFFIEDPDVIPTEKESQENLATRNAGRILKAVGILLGFLSFIIIQLGFRSPLKKPKLGLIVIGVSILISMIICFIQGINLGPTDSSIYGDAFHLNQYYDMLTFRFDMYLIGLMHPIFLIFIVVFYIRSKRGYVSNKESTV